MAGNDGFSGIRPSKSLYLGLGAIALLKDVLDFALLGSLPGIGTVITACFSFLIWMLMTLFDHSGGKSSKKMARGQVLIFASLVEGLGFGLNFLPIETFTVIALYFMASKAAKKEEKRLAGEKEVQNRANQTRAYRIQAQVAQQARLEREAANDERYQQAA
ncbi:MAG: hypothetical protein KBA91_03620 [Candidatus Moranbacteria bacterium]|jgi:hypothetical protein|nr:hypothetical protein [Candidatus Moranbacteria bacterium]